MNQSQTTDIRLTQSEAMAHWNSKDKTLKRCLRHVICGLLPRTSLTFKNFFRALKTKLENRDTAEHAHNSVSQVSCASDS